MEDKDLKKLLSREKLTRKSQPRDRRPEDYELEEIYNEFETRQQSKRVKIPYTLVYLITLCTGLRENEIVNLRAEDLNYSSKFIYLRTFKNDGGLEAENNWVKQPLVRGSFELLTTYLKSTGIKKGKIFNFKAKSISAAFRRVRKHLEMCTRTSGTGKRSQNRQGTQRIQRPSCSNDASPPSRWGVASFD